MEMSKLFISEDKNIMDALKQIDETAKKILFVVEGDLLKGSITDGDIRRWILRNGDFTASIKEIINYNPKYIMNTEKNMANEIMEKYSIEALPILNINGEIEEIVFWDYKTIKANKEKIDAPVVIMAGGLGTRLHPYTKIVPKPLIPIGDTPIMERIINKFNYSGCDEFYVSVNYKKNMIKAYFQDLNKNYLIEYLEEKKPLGTGGSLYMLKDKIKKTFFLTNCDVLIEASYKDIYNYHKENKNFITMVCAIKNITIPYGVIELNKKGSIENIKEKPEYSFLTNTGMYILEPEIIDDMEEDRLIHMPEIIDIYRKKGKKVGVYPISEGNWMDMGEHSEMRKMIEKLGV